jgi:hypothetical protein
MIMKRFWSKVKKTPDCWFWLGCTAGGGYGWFWRNGGPEYAHRVAYELIFSAIPQGMDVLHHCDNKRCVNPAHLFLGKHIDNMRDMINKGRGVFLKGEEHGQAKLTWKEVNEIRASYPIIGSQRKLAKQFGVSQHQIFLIINNKNWRI